MNQIPSLHPDAIPALTSGPLLHAELVDHPRFPHAEEIVARRLIDLQGRAPRLVRLKSSHRKWLITHSLFALDSQRHAADPLSGLTASRLVDAVVDISAASRNTASAFVQELLAYKFLRELPDTPDRRVRLLQLTDISVNAMKTWFDAHMEALDAIDGGNRAAVCAARPDLFRPVHRQATAVLVEDAIWREPRASVAPFLWSDAGGMVLHDLITRLPTARTEGDKLMLGPLALSDLAERYAVSVSNIKRMFASVEKQDLAGWTQARRRGDFWISRAMLADYFHWQAAKFAALDAALHALAPRAEPAAPQLTDPPPPAPGCPAHTAEDRR